MWKYITIFLILFYIDGNCQDIFKVDANLYYYGFDTNYFINTKITWGIYQDTIGVMFLEKEYYYFDLNSKERKKYEILIKSVDQKNKEVNSREWYLKKDKYNEIYTIRIITKNGLLIQVTNYFYRHPVYVITNSNKLCQ